MSPSVEVQGSNPTQSDGFNRRKMKLSTPLMDGIMFPKQNLLPTIRLRDPLLQQSFTSGKYTTYKILIETEHHAFHLRTSCIRRRYSELRWLCSTLQAHHKQVKLPPIPSKKIWSERFNTEFVNTRMAEMEVFLNELIKIDTILSDTAIHLFLQTDLTPDEMNEYLTGQSGDDLMDKVWANQGHLHTANELGTFLSIATPREIEMDSEDEMLACGSNSTISTLSTNFNSLHANDNHGIQCSSPTKTTVTTSAQPTVGFQTRTDNGMWLPEIPDIDDNDSSVIKPDTPSTASGDSNSSSNDNESSGNEDSGKGDHSTANSEDNENGNCNDTLSSVTMSTDDSAWNSSPALSEDIRSSCVTPSTGSDS